MKTKTITILIIALVSTMFLSGCFEANQTNYNNNRSFLWGLVNWTNSGGEGTDDAPALKDTNPDTKIEQKGSNRGSKNWK